MMNLFHEVSQDCSRIATEKYSTSFSSAIKLLHKDLRVPIFNVYGFVRFADEIVDTFHQHDKSLLLDEFKKATYEAIDRGVSLNPILHSFQLTVNQYGIDRQLIDAFLYSMELDLEKRNYDRAGYEQYIYGSAEVVGLMCLYIFCDGNKDLYEDLKPYARSLGAAFQKVNFLRDLKADVEGLDRMYFPGCDFSNFTERDKSAIETDIQRDFDHAYEGILKLPVKARFGVYVAYKYYVSLFRKIKKMHPHRILENRIRIPDYGKMMILAKAGIRAQLNLL
ncbi:MAG: phytoene/squalene synthase family protein [Chitinophagaceae bacterium]|nr:phytoene/squalene synthase family protein [Chitinophagaceae bacterium]MEA3425597.1 phytoene/squalene synthase family protein [Bacteroidota bacterium]MCA6452089.1 phytoene/squalene synthase family protein [Chitinophagaceae bacterium]MCA6457246.1 phytoene/squalene synthase family protein [Chitinophagaceae bacterium]MCA6459905.1 phytoene/squalene synthase family protein [Chitinophagaceae bacterium]